MHIVPPSISMELVRQHRAELAMTADQRRRLHPAKPVRRHHVAPAPVERGSARPGRTFARLHRVAVALAREFV